MAAVIDNGIEAGNISNVYFYGLCMIMTAVLGLVCGVLAGRYAAIACITGYSFVYRYDYG